MAASSPALSQALPRVSSLEPALDDLDLVAEDVDLRLLLLDELLGKPLQVGQIDGLLADVEFLVELLGLVLEGPVMQAEIRRLAISRSEAAQTFSDFLRLGVERGRSSRRSCRSSSRPSAGGSRS